MFSLPRAFVPRILVDNPMLLSKSESKHLSKVLRIGIGRKLVLLDGKGMWAESRLSGEVGGLLECCVESELRCAVFRDRITTVVAVPRSSTRMNWLVEKLTEVGVGMIVPIITTHSTMDTSTRMINQGKIERWQRVAQEATKQAQRWDIPIITPPTTLEELFEQRSKYNKREGKELLNNTSIFDFLAAMPTDISRGAQYIQHKGKQPDQHIYHSSLTNPISAVCKLVSEANNSGEYTTNRDITLFIGPEGDFSIQEKELLCKQGVIPVHLGYQRLRVETAAVILSGLATQAFLRPVIMEQIE